MSTRVAVRLCAQGDNLARFGPDGGLVVEDRHQRAAVADGPLNYWTYPNHLTASTQPLWWRPCVGSAATASVTATGVQVLQPLLVAKPCVLRDLAVSINAWTTGTMQWGLYQYAERFAQFSRMLWATSVTPTGVSQVVTLTAALNQELVAGRPYVLGWAPLDAGTLVHGRGFLNPWGDASIATNLAAMNTSGVVVSGLPQDTPLIDPTNTAAAARFAPTVMPLLQNYS